MKKIILATTALVATAGVASADISLNAAANFGVKYNGATDATTVHNELDFGISATGESDNGVAFGASIDLDTQSDDSATTAGAVNDPEAFISFGGLTLTVGEIGEADDISNLSDVGYDGIGVDDDADGLAASGSHDVSITYAMDAVTFALSMDSDSAQDDWAIGVSGSFNGFDAALGYNDNDGTTVTSLALGYSVGNVGFDVYFADSSAGVQGMGFDVTYSMNAMTLTLAYGDTDAAGDDEDFGVGVSYDLGGGLAVAGGVGSVDGNTMADFGVVMSF
jgi:outer membrane protein OmpU